MTSISRPLRPVRISAPFPSEKPKPAKTPLVPRILMGTAGVAVCAGTATIATNTAQALFSNASTNTIADATMVPVMLGAGALLGFGMIGGIGLGAIMIGASFCTSPPNTKHNANK